MSSSAIETSGNARVEPVNSSSGVTRGDENFRQAHKDADTDADWSAIHHTLGLGGNRAIPATALANIAPIGQRITMGGPLAATAPPGFLKENGGLYPTAKYPALFKVIGYTYGGSGDNFNVPNAANGYIRYSWGV